MVEVGIVGGTGYTGMELLRLLAVHPDIRVAEITSRGESGVAVEALFPALRGQLDLVFTEPDMERLSRWDAVFFATPNGTAMQMAPALLEAGCRVVDLGADFRLRNAAQWAEWYGMEHTCPDLLKEAVYGLTEVNRDAVAGARLVANPGCYPTAVGLGLLPLLEAGAVAAETVVADCKSGVSGAGRAAKVSTLFGEVNESFKGYSAGGHRHQPEIEQTMRDLWADTPPVVFTPHLVPMTRGMLATIHVRLADPGIDLQRLYEERYRDEGFVDVLPLGSHPETRWVRGTNHCHIGIHRPAGDAGHAVIFSAIDNLTKGAAGQAIQNLNRMLGLDERAGLAPPPALP